MHVLPPLPGYSAFIYLMCQASLSRGHSLRLRQATVYPLLSFSVRTALSCGPQWSSFSASVLFLQFVVHYFRLHTKMSATDSTAKQLEAVSSTDHEISKFYDSETDVGKGGIWDPASGLYYYLDITRKSLHVLRVSDMHREDFDVGTQVGAMALIEGGSGLMMAVENGFGLWDFSAKKLQMIASPYGVDSGWRMNDGACDSQGRFWAGRLFMADETKPGEIYRLERDGKSVTSVIKGIACTNGVLWNPENTLMYCGDSSFKKIYVWDYNEKTGDVSNQRLFIDTADKFAGVPDGATIDKDGFLWVCFFDGSKLVRISPDAKVDKVIDMPVKRPTQPVWFGAELNELLVTSAMKDVGKEKSLENGNIVRLSKVGAQGQLKSKFKFSP